MDCLFSRESMKNGARGQPELDPSAKTEGLKVALSSFLIQVLPLKISRKHPIQAVPYPRLNIRHTLR